MDPAKISRAARELILGSLESDKSVNLRTDGERHALWFRAAQAAGMSLTAWIERCLDGEATRLLGEQSPIDRRTLKESLVSGKVFSVLLPAHRLPVWDKIAQDAGISFPQLIEDALDHAVEQPPTERSGPSLCAPDGTCARQPFSMRVPEAKLDLWRKAAHTRTWFEWVTAAVDVWTAFLRVE